MAVLPAVMDVAEMHGAGNQKRHYRRVARTLERRYQHESNKAALWFIVLQHCWEGASSSTTRLRRKRVAAAVML